MANLITILRILASVALLFCPALSPAFFAVYIFAGVTDMLDGFVARRTGTVSDLGAKLDTIADFALAAVCLCKLLPILDLSGWLYGWIALIALIKVVNIVSGYVVKKGVRIAPYPYEQSDRRFAVSPAADVVLHRIEIHGHTPLRRCHLRCRSGRSLYPNGTQGIKRTSLYRMLRDPEPGDIADGQGEGDGAGLGIRAGLLYDGFHDGGLLLGSGDDEDDLLL